MELGHEIVWALFCFTMGMLFYHIVLRKKLKSTGPNPAPEDEQAK